MDAIQPEAETTDVGVIMADCLLLLDEIHQQFRDDPEGEYRRLSMLALEREQLVSYAYKDDILLRRIRGLVAPAPFVTVFHHAFTQVWRDEEAHTVLMRGMLVRDRNAVAAFKTMTEQAAGLLAGWSSALKHHVPRSSAPMRSLLVDGIAIGGRAIGKLSPDLRAELNLKTFRDFCLYNVDAEETAELCWRRLIALDEELGYGNTETFERIAREERQHLEVFATVAEYLDEYDWLRPGTSVDEVSRRLAAIDERFALPDYRQRPKPSFGSASPVHVISETADKVAAADAALAVLQQDLDGRIVAIKPSWMMGYSLEDKTSVTDPELVAHIVNRVKEAGAAEVILLEGPNLYSSIFSNRDVTSVANYFGFDSVGCDIVDAGADTVAVSETNALGQRNLSRRWVEADVRISITRLRSHPTEQIHGATANLEGLMAGFGQEVFWTRQYVHTVAALAVAVEAPPHLSIIDAWDDCPDGLFGVMAGSHRSHPRRMYASTDALSCDLIALRHTGSARGVGSSTLRRAIELFGDPRPDIEVRGVDTEIVGWLNPYRNKLTGFMADLSYPVMAYLSCSGALFAPPMDDLFVEVKALPLPHRVIRSTARRFLGLHPPRD